MYVIDCWWGHSLMETLKTELYVLLCFCSRLFINCFYCLSIKMSKYQYVFFAAPMLRYVNIYINQ